MLETQKKSVKAGKLVDTGHVNASIRNYKKERWVHNSKRLGKEDSLSVWYSLDELEEFLKKSKANGGDGIRIYFGVYDTDHAPQPQHAGRQTVILVATKEKETENGRTSKDIYIPAENGTTILAYNMGRPCPPFCNHNDDSGSIGITIVDKGSEGMMIA